MGVTAAVKVVMTEIRASSTDGSGSGTNDFNHGHTKECSYKDFMICGPKSFDGNGGFIALMQWFEKTESNFELCACHEGRKVKFVAYTFSDRALTWWNIHVKSLTLPIANAVGWENLKEMMLEEYGLRGEIQKL